METLTALPESFPAGTTVKYTRSLPDYPATDGWQLKLLLAGASLLSVDAEASGADHSITISATASGPLTPGSYVYAEEVTKDGETYRAGSGRVSIEPDLGRVLAGQLQSPNERLLAAITAMIEARMGAGTGIPKDAESYQIDGIAVTKVPLERLLSARTALSYSVAREKRPGGLGRQYRMTFTGARNE